MRQKHPITILAVLTAASALTAQAQFIVQPTKIDGVSSEVNNREAVNTINGSGLSNSNIVETDDSIPSTYPTHSTSNLAVWWTDVGDNNLISDVFITFDLGGTYDLDGMHVWNLNGSGGGRTTKSGVEDFILEVSTNGTTFTNEGTFSLNEAPDSSTYTGETINFNKTITGSHVRINVQTTFENDGSITDSTANRAGLSEVRFTAIPEPLSSAAVIGLVALTAVCALRRRRK